MLWKFRLLHLVILISFSVVSSSNSSGVNSTEDKNKTDNKNDSGIIGKSKVSVDSTENPLLAGENDEGKDDKEVEVTRVYLYKCEGAYVTLEFLDIPDSLRIPYISEKFEYFKRRFNREDLFNFTLKESDRPFQDKCASEAGSGSGQSENQYRHEKDEISFFPLEISKVSGFTKNPHFNFTPDGYLGYYRDVTESESDLELNGGVAGRREEIFIHPDNFCISSISQDAITVHVCKSQCHTEESEKGPGICIPKCCTFGQVMTPTGCQDTTGDDWNPDVYLNPRLKITNVNNSSTNETEMTGIHPNFHLNYYNTHWNCSTKLSNVGPRNDELRIFSNGRVYVKGQSLELPWYSISTGGDFRQFCTDGFWKADFAHQEYKPDEWNSTNFVQSCKPAFSSAEAEEKLLRLSWTYPQILFFVTLISTIIHLLTVSVYSALVGGLNVHGWTILSFSACQFLLNLLLVGHFAAFAFGDTNVTRELGRGLNSLCVTYGIMHQFLLISVFSWSTALTFDVWAKIQSMTPTSRNYKGKKRFSFYCLFGFGVPLIIVLISIVVEFSTGESIPVEYPEFPGFISNADLLSNATSRTDLDFWIRPKYKESCIILGGRAYLLYIGLPITSFLGANMIFALLTVKVLWDAKKNVQSFKDSSTSATLENKAKLVGKLFILMGLFLFFEILLTFWTPVFDWIGFAVFDLYRIINALALFWIFVLNKRIPTQLGEKFPSIKRYLKAKTEQTVVSTIQSN